MVLLGYHASFPVGKAVFLQTIEEINSIMLSSGDCSASLGQV